MTATSSPIPPPTLWGLTPTELHDRFWAARGVQVVRHGEPSQIVDDAELFLLTDSRTLVFLKLSRVVERLTWLQPDAIWVRVHDSRDRGYRELAVSDEHDRFVGFRRLYASAAPLVGRVAFTSDREVARSWQNAPDRHSAWRRLRRSVPRNHRDCTSMGGSLYERDNPAELKQLTHDLMRIWKRPDRTIRRARQASGEAWTDSDSAVEADASFIGPVWIGAGRAPGRGATIVGPAILWDNPAARPPAEAVQWEEIEPVEGNRPVHVRRASSFSRVAKRLFDFAFALVALALTLPLYPLIMLAILIEDGRPFFFLHRRETRGGKQFGCIKFRSMRKDAERIKAQLMAANQADGPQFFIESDPRLTRVGRLLRAYNLDELPQFINVLLGQMSVVGPRPSPHRENQFCPAWREARLSVRPGITGLWQISRTRRAGTDFQEWIKYDLEYVEKASWLLDLRIIWKTAVVLIRGGSHS